jgi:hypothetical protein
LRTVQYLTIWDFILTPVYLLALIAIAKNRREKKYPLGHPLRKYYLPGLYAKFGGAIFIGLIYQYYYGGGDTFNFFTHAKIINSALGDSFTTWLKLIVHTPTDQAPEIYSYASQLYWYNSTNDYAVGVITAIIGLFTFTTYLPTALLFAFISYTGIWAMYTTFVRLYPKMVKPLAIAFLFVPSTVVWGSGIFKDTICMFGLGWLTYCTFRIFVNKDLSIKNLLLLVLSLYLIAVIKLYILLAFLPALGLWLLMTYSHRVSSPALRFLLNIAFAGMVAGAFFLFADKFAAEMNKYSLDKIAQTAARTQGWISYVSDIQEGSGYDIGKFDPTILGMLSKFPQGVVVTLFRPFIWEAKKPIVLLSSLEAMAFLYFTLLLIFKNGTKLIKWTRNDPNLFFFLVYSLIFAFAVGVSTGNFGTLSRYKIPCVPFYAAFLLVLLHKQKHSVNVKERMQKKSVRYFA